MKILVLFALIAVASAEEFFPTDVDNPELASVVVKNNMIRIFHECILQLGPCAEFPWANKDFYINAVQQACMACNKYQKRIFWMLLKSMKAVSPEYYLKFRQKFDPENKYFEDFEKAISSSMLFR